jgi:hypothetical protein
MLESQLKNPIAEAQNRFLAPLLVISLLVVLLSSSTSAENWEPLETRKAADLQPAEVLTGEHFNIGATVETDGFLNFYDLQTD